MFAETARLVITVETKDVAEAQRRLEGLGKVSQATEKATDGLAWAASRLFAIYAAGKAVLSAGSGFKNTITEYESLRGQLKTATGSAENALVAFEALKEFAIETPYGLKQATDAFIQLTNLGLTPSERALRSYGNTASATGFQLTDMAYAVSRTVAGEFEPLRKFGITAKKEADGLALSFRGVTEKVTNDARAIEEYFIRLGETKFATAMADQMVTLRGAFANLEDAWEQMYDQIGSMGVGNLIGTTIRSATAAIEDFTARLASGQITGYIDAIIAKFYGLYQAGKEIFDDFRGLFPGEFQLLKDLGGGAIDWLTDAFKNFPENVAVYMRAVGATFKWLGTYAQAGGKMVVEIFKGYWGFLVDGASNAMTAVGELLKNPLNASDIYSRFIAKQAVALSDFSDVIIKEYSTAVDKATKADKSWEASIVRAMDLRDASIAKTKEQIQAADDLYEAKKKELAIDRALREFFQDDRLARFRTGADNPAPNLSEAQRGQFEALRDSLGLQEEAIARSYEKRKKLIIDSTHEQKTLQLQLLRDLDVAVAGEMARAGADRYGQVEQLRQNLFEAQAQGRAVEVEALRMQLEHEMQMLKEANEFRKQVILNDATLTAEEKNRRIMEIEKRHQAQMLALDRMTQSARLNLAADFFGNMAAVASAFGKKGAKIAQAAAIVQTTIKTYESATSAYASLAGIPYVGPALGAAAAAAAIAGGMANIAAIRSASYQGAYAYGGAISPGKFGLVGETGMPELVEGPAMVKSARTTQNLLNKPQKAGNVTVNVVNNAGVQVETRESDGVDGKVIELIISKAVDRITDNIDRGGNKLSETMQSRFGLRRASTNAA